MNYIPSADGYRTFPNTSRHAQLTTKDKKRKVCEIIDKQKYGGNVLSAVWINLQFYTRTVFYFSFILGLKG